MKRNSKHRLKKQEITLMTILANEATKESQAILKKYNQPKAQSYNELEMKLAELYFQPKTDKRVLEKELANIHPHKKWLVRTLELDKKPKVDEVKTVETQTEVCEDDKCVTHTDKAVSNFAGKDDSPAEAKSNRTNIEVIGLVGIIGLMGLTFIIVSKNLK